MPLSLFMNRRIYSKYKYSMYKNDNIFFRKSKVTFYILYIKHVHIEFLSKIFLISFIMMRNIIISIVYHAVKSRS